MWRGPRLFGWVCLSTCLAAATASAAEAPLVISTLPFDDAKAQQAVFGMLSRELGKELGRPVSFRAGTSYQEVIDGLAKGEVDVGFVGAAAYVEARRSGSVRAILRALRHRNSKYHGVIVVRAGSELKSLKDLAGKKFAFVDRNSTAGFFFPSLLMRRAGIDPEKGVQAVFAGGHHKVVELVATGKVDAGACYEGAESTLPNPEAVVAIARTEAIPGDPVVVRPGLGADLVSALRSALIGLSSVPDAQAFFTYAEIDGFVPAIDSDYDGVATVIKGMGG